MTFLELRSISKSFGPTRVLNDVTLMVGERTKTAIVGPSGSGKTTLLRILAGFEWPDTGSVTLEGRDLASHNAAVPAHNRNIGIVSQDGALFPHLNVADNIGFALNRHDPKRGRRIEELIEMVGMDRSFLKRNPDQLSGGQQQRVALARALARKPRLMLLDEPFSALDTALRATTRRAVSALLDATGVTTILVTHDQVEALSFADQVAVMRDGRIVQAGAPPELYRRPATPMIARFLGDAVIVPADLRDGFAHCLLGQVGVPEGARSGRHDIMLRPEQIVLVKPTSELSVARRAQAIVESVEFGGAFCVCVCGLRHRPMRWPIKGSSWTCEYRVSTPQNPEQWWRLRRSALRTSFRAGLSGIPSKRASRSTASLAAPGLLRFARNDGSTCEKASG